MQYFLYQAVLKVGLNLKSSMHLKTIQIHEDKIILTVTPAPTSSLELLASLTPEAFTLDASLKGKQRMNKQNFLQAQTGEGLRAPRPSDDPLSMLDPLWTLNKS